MQELYLEDLGNASEGVVSDAATVTPNVEIKAAKGISSKTLNCEKGEIAVESEAMEKIVPEFPGSNGNDEDLEKLKEAEDTLKSLANADPKANVVPDVPTSLAQDQPQDDVMDDLGVQQDKNLSDHVIADSPEQQERNITVDENTDNAMSVEDNIDYVTADEDAGVEDDLEDEDTEDDVTIMKIIGDSKRKSGKTGVSSRLRARKGKMNEVVAETPKSIKKKGVAAEATKSPKKRKVTAEATKSAKKKMYGPGRRSSRVEIPAKQKKQGSKRKTIDLSESDAEEDAPIITTSSKQKIPKKKKNCCCYIC
ncbi:hypothetical protein P8452_21401 [Trifolium repens]|nr:hypothetical protein P8452_21401 [Trifolium repens]